MNKIYRVIWNLVSRNWVAVSEAVAGHGKSHSQRQARVADASVEGTSAHMAPHSSLCLLPKLLLGLGLSLASLSALAQPPAATALPTGGVVSAGQATISQSGSQMRIVQGSDKAALNWQSFNIGASAGVTFQQPSSQSIALNRVAGADPSQIYGTLNANGKLILINPNGVLFGQGSRVDAAGLIATTKALSDADFMNSNYRFAGGGSGVVRNDGTLVAAPDGAILLVADKVINTGTMQAPGGEIGLLSVNDLQIGGDWETAAAANAAVASMSDVTVENFGRIDVSGVRGGKINMMGGNGTTQSSGALLAIGEQGNGGNIYLSGMQVGLMKGSLTDASGVTGGGTVLAGGDWQGGGSMQHALATYMDADAMIRVNATGQGHGGKAVMWSDGYTNFRGQIQANGAGAGNGGQVETSGKDILDAIGSVTAQGVQAGKWLLDPSNVTIVSATSPSVLDPATNTYNPTTATGTISNTEINTALDNGTSVTISTAAGPTNGANANNGKIIQEAGADIVKSIGNNATLSLIANRIIDLQGNIDASGAGKLYLVLDASGGTNTKSGAIITRGNIATNGGDVTFKSGVMAIGTSAQTIGTAGGAVNFNSDLEIANPIGGLTIDTVNPLSGTGGAVTFGGKVDSGDRYELFTAAGNTTWQALNTAVKNGTTAGTTVGDTFMAQPLSELENSVISYTSDFQTIALGGNYSGGWKWITGEKGGQIFNTSANTRTPTTYSNGDDVYQNWAANAPANYTYYSSGGTFPSYYYTTNLIANSLGQWSVATFNYLNVGRYTVKQTVAETSSLTVNAGNGAGAGAVTFSGRVGSFKPLKSLTVSGPTAINGKQVTTEQGQTYNSAVTIGVAPTLLESTKGSLQLDNSITFNQAISSALTIRALQDITLNGAIAALDGALAVTMTADISTTNTNTGTGSITINKPVTTRGGAIVLTSSSGMTFNGEALDTSSGGAGPITLVNRFSGDIIATPGATMTTGGGNISVTNKTTGAAAAGVVSLQDLNGGAITVVNDMLNLPAGNSVMVKLNRPVAGGGRVTIRSLRGDVQIDGAITGAGLPVTITADSAASGNGAIMLNSPITTTGGEIVLTASSGIALNGAALNTGPNAGDITLENKNTGNITATAGSVMTAGSGTITVTNGLSAGVSGNGNIDLQDLTGGTIAVANNVNNVTAGNAVALNGPVTGGGAVSVSSMSGDILAGGTITGSALRVAITADSKNTGIGAITLNGPVTTGGGAITLTASSGIVLNGALSTGGSTNGITLTNKRSGDINAMAGATMNSAGNISVINDEAAGAPSDGGIALQDLTGAGITVTNNVSNLTNGLSAITLNGSVLATTGTVSVASKTGDILVKQIISSGASNNNAAIIIGAATSKGAADSSGGDVKLQGGSRLGLPADSRAIIYSGSIGGTEGVGETGGAGYPIVGNYRYNVAYNNTSRLQNSPAGTYVQYREQPTLQITLPDKIYDATPLNTRDWNSYVVVGGWRNGDNPTVNPLTGNLMLNGGTVAQDANTYVIGNAALPGALADTLGYKLDITGETGTPVFTITKRHLTVGDLTVQTRKYDTTTNALITGGILFGVQGNDDVSLNGTIGQFADKNVGVNKTVLVDHVDLSGTKRNNYIVDYVGSSTTGEIQPAELRVSGVHPLDRVYDGTTNASFTGEPVLSGILPGDEGKVTAPIENVSGHFVDRNAGVDKEVAVFLSGGELSGPEAHNYTLVGVDGEGKIATITPAPLRVNGSYASKLFDGTTDSNSSATVAGLMPGDSVGNVRQYFDTAAWGKNKTLSIIGNFTINDGNNGNNYIIESNILARGEIRSIPSPQGMGSNPFNPGSKNLDLLLPVTILGDMWRAYQQADYFLHPGTAPKKSTTHVSSSSQ